MKALYVRAQLDELTLKQARRAVHSARYWREEASAPLTYIRPSRCRAEARAALAHAARLRCQLAALRAVTGRYVTCEQ
ncbi:hypothetical protein ACF1AB_35105 [Streptomyces sp. NPDC014846]|uniref:hypothetical protein n=1 Tax=Streptomyces sp. NPDC014846 TaxID=3364922 RepID=UPI0036FBCB67